MVAALPVQDHLDVLGFNAHDDFAQRRTHDPLPCRRRGGRMRPGEFEVDAEPHQLLPLPLAQRRRLPCLDGGDLALDPAHDLQRLVHRRSRSSVLTRPPRPPQGRASSRPNSLVIIVSAAKIARHRPPRRHTRSVRDP